MLCQILSHMSLLLQFVLRWKNAVNRALLQDSPVLLFSELGNGAYGFRKFQDVAVIIASYKNTVILSTNHEYMQVRSGKRVGTNG